MSCKNMFLAKKRDGSLVSVPCGQCLSCRIQKQTYLEFVGKMAALDFARQNKGSCLFTLTYDEASVPITFGSNVATRREFLTTTLLPKHLTLFFKRLRKDLKQTGLKYIACGEYGGDNGDNRPHYHGVLFGVDYAQAVHAIRKCWRAGYSQCGALRQGGVRYVVDYVIKQQFGKEAEKLYDLNGRVRPFWRRSSYLGYYSILTLMDDDDFTYVCNNQRRLVPSQIRKKFGISYSPYDWFKLTIHKAKALSMTPSEYLNHISDTVIDSYVARCHQKGIPVEIQTPREVISPERLDYLVTEAKYFDEVPF